MSESPFSLYGRVALVTGNSTGLGRGIGLGLGKAGAKVPVSFCNRDECARATLALYRKAGIETVLIRADVTTEEGVEQLVGQVQDQLGAIDIVVPNATCQQPIAPIEEYDWASCQSMLAYFVKSPLLLTQRVLPHMKAQRWGRIVNVSSDVFHRAIAPFSGYVAAKGAQIGWTRSMATELAPYGITVNTVAPGWIPVERHAQDPQSVKEQYLATIPVGRWGKPEDVANAVIYFASREASFVTGQTLCINGGLSPW